MTANSTVTTVVSPMLLVFLLALGGFSKAQLRAERQSLHRASTATISSDSLNTLTEAERQAGWQLLFDGSDLSQWRGFQREGLPEGWDVADRAIHTSGAGAGDLITKAEYDQFELAWEWKISEGGNSGVMFHISEDSTYEHTFQTGPEYQIIDDEGYATELEDTQKAGANYALHAPSKDVVRPANEWNKARLVVRGDSVEHWLGGEKVVAYALHSENWRQRVQQSKFGQMPGYGQEGRGHIALQDHGDEVWFRNLKIRPLGDSKHGNSESDSRGFDSLFDGETLDGWHRHTGLPGDQVGGKWEVQDGAIVGDQHPPGHGGFLVTDNTYRDFVLTLEAKLDYPVDSGIFLRVGESGESHQVTLDYRPEGYIGAIYMAYLNGMVHKNPDGIKYFKRDAWNDLKVRIEGSPAHIQFWLNGEQVTDFQHTEETSEGAPREGTIGLQVHPGESYEAGKKVRFRNIQVKPLSLN